MTPALWTRSMRDSWPMLVSCCMLVLGFVCLRLWIAAQFDLDEVSAVFSKVVPEYFQRLLPVPIETLMSVEGRVAIGFEELPTLLLLALWTVARGTECLAGRLGDGTMEMLLAQPVRRLALVTSHTGVTLFGTVFVALSAWLGTALGIQTVDFDEPTNAATYLPAVANYFCLGVFLVGIATLASAVARSRGQAVAIFVAFYVVQLTCKIFGLMLPSEAWLKRWSILSAYEPTYLTVGLKQDPAHYGPLLWQYNVTLACLGVVSLTIASMIFCHRDVSAPL